MSEENKIEETPEEKKEEKVEDVKVDVVVEDDKKKKKRETKTKPLEPIDPTPFYVVPLKLLQEKYFELMEQEKTKVVWITNEKTNQKEIECASPRMLVQELTSEVNYDQHFLNHFMVTYRSFISRDEFIELLVERFNVPPPVGSSHDDFAQFKKETLDKIRLRVTNTLKYWIEKFYIFDFHEEEMKDKLNQVIEMMEKSNGASYAKAVKNALEKAQSTDTGKVESTMNMLKTIPLKKKSVFQKKKKVTDPILEYDPLEIARQITLIEFEIFSKIEPKECLNQNWNKGLRETKAPNISDLINWFNQLSNWIGTVIVNTVDLQDRIKVMSIFIEIAKNLNDLNNFNGIFSVCSGLALAPIFRLKDTWNGLDEEIQTIFKTLNAYISREKNFRNIRTAIKQVKPPCIPYLGLYLTDLTFIEDGNPKYITVEGNKLVNFVKCRGFASVIYDMQIYQSQRYPIQKYDQLYDLLKKTSALGEEEMYQKSLEREERKGKGPKKREKKEGEETKETTVKEN